MMRGTHPIVKILIEYKVNIYKYFRNRSLFNFFLSDLEQEIQENQENRVNMIIRAMTLMESVPKIHLEKYKKKAETFNKKQKMLREYFKNLNVPKNNFYHKLHFEKVLISLQCQGYLNISED